MLHPEEKNMRRYMCMILITCYLLAGCGETKTTPATWTAPSMARPVLLGEVRQDDKSRGEPGNGEP